MDNALKKIKSYYEGALAHPTYSQWLAAAQEAWNFYDGKQWAEDEVQKLQAHAQPAIVINKIAAKVDNIAGTEIASRTRVVYRSRSGVQEEEQTARALTDLALYVAERNDQSIELSQVFRAGLVTGIGWLDVGVEMQAEGPFIFNRAENELDVVWDPNSTRLDYSDARFVCRQRDLDEQDAKQQLSRERRLMSDAVRGQKLELQNSLFQLADQEQDLDTARAYQAGVSSQGLASAMNESNNASLRDYYSRQVTAAQSRGPGLFSSVLSAAATPLTGSVAGGLLSGGFFGSLFGRR